MIANGPFFTATMGALSLENRQRSDALRNASGIVSATLRAYGTTANGDLDATRLPNAPITGLVYGRIQSGKTRAMIATTAMAFDNGFRIVVVMTSDINDLVAQTHLDFLRGLPGIVTFTKDDDLDRDVATTSLHLERNDGRLLIVCSKGSTSLQNITRFLRAIHAENYTVILFDDEGDQASLDTNTRRRSRTGVAVAPSAINDIIQNQLRPAVPRHVYVGVTGTPQAVLLQSADSANRPSFIEILPAGAGYVGGERFFSAEEPEDNAALIALVDQEEKTQLLDRALPIPDGLRRSLLFFLVSACAAIQNRGLPDRGYSYLCHPSLRNEEQATAEARINEFLNQVLEAVLDGGSSETIGGLRSAHAELQRTLADATPDFDVVLNLIRRHLPSRRLLVINARVKRQGIQYGGGLNFLVGGNTLGRGIAIRDLLVTYYVRDARVSQIDTMHQHARMYGYRSETLAYTRLFVPRHLYYRFRDIVSSDEDLRGFIESHRAELPSSFPVEYQFDLRTTRPGVLDVGKVDTIQPGKQIYPNHVVFPQDDGRYRHVLRLLGDHFGRPGGSVDDIVSVSGNGVEIDPADAVAIVSRIRTASRNTWRDATIGVIMGKVTDRLNSRILLRFRRASRSVQAGGFISTGLLFGGALTAARNLPIPTLWIMAAETAPGSVVGDGLAFMYPSFVVPNNLPGLFMFNRG